MSKGGAVMTGDAIRIYRLLAIKTALKLRAAGIKVSRNADPMRVVKRDYPALYHRNVHITLRDFTLYCDSEVAAWAANGRPGLEVEDD